jgi:hypothetical protein
MTIGCSNNSPTIETNNIVVEENPRNIDAKAANLKLSTDSEQPIRDSILLIKQYHQEDFNFVRFWSGLTYPAIDFLAWSNLDMIALSEVQQISCNYESNYSYILFLERILDNSSLSHLHLVVKSNLVKALSNCITEFKNEKFELIIKYYTKPKSSEDVEVYIQLLDVLKKSYSNNFHSWGEVSVLRHDIEILSDKYIKTKRYKEVITLSNKLKLIFPYKKDLAYIGIKKIISNNQFDENILNYLSFENLISLIKNSSDDINLIDDIEKYNILQNIVISKMLNKKVDDILFYEDFLNKMEFLNSVLVKLDLNLTEYLQSFEILVNSFNNQTSSLIALNYIEDSSIYSFVSLYSKLRKKEITKNYSLERIQTSNRYSVFLNDYANLFSMTNNVNKKELLSSLCARLPNKKSYLKHLKLTDLGCLELKDNSIVIDNDLELSIFSILKTNNKTLTVKGHKINIGVIDLSSTINLGTAIGAVTPKSSNAIAFPLVFAFKAKSNRGLIRKQSNYYLPYHFVYQEARDGIAQSEVHLPKNGISGGHLYKERSSRILGSFVSTGSEGQSAAPASKAGAQYNLELDHLGIDFWISDITSTNSYLVVDALAKNKAIQDLLTVAKRDDENNILSYVDLHFLELLGSKEKQDFVDNLNLVKKQMNLKCEDLKCSLEFIISKAIVEITALDANNNHQKIISKINETYTSTLSEGGSVFTDGVKGKNGEIINL